MSDCFCHATVRDGDWRERLWTDVFGKPEAPVVQPFPVERAELAGEPDFMVRLDKTRCSVDQLRQLGKGIARQFGLPVAEVVDDMLDPNKIAPIRCDRYVTVVGCPRHVLGAIL